MSSNNKSILIVSVGSTFECLINNPNVGNFENMVQSYIKLNNIKPNYIIIKATDPNCNLPTNFDSFLAIIIPGSHDMVTEHLPWSENVAEWIKNYVIPSNVPLLGICYGHQLIGYALGGKVDYNPFGKELGCIQLTFSNCNNDPVFKQFYNKTYNVVVAHSQSILEAPKCDDFYSIAQSECDSFEAVHFTGNVWGVQFHPEFCLETIKTYVQNHKDKVAKNCEKNSYNLVDDNFNEALMTGFIEYALKL